MTIRELLAIATAPILEVKRTHHIVPSPQNLLRLSWALHSGGMDAATIDPIIIMLLTHSNY
jgi:hypothetical protein